MTIAKLLNLDLCPRLYSLRDRHLHVPRRFEVPAAIGGIVQHDVSLEPIRQGWGDLLSVAATIEEGWRSATDVLETIRQCGARRSYLSGRPCAGSTAAHRLPVRLLCAAGLSQAPVPRPRTRRVRPCPAATNLQLSGLEECEEFLVHPVLQGGAHTVRRSLVHHQLGILDNLGG